MFADQIRQIDLSGGVRLAVPAGRGYRDAAAAVRQVLLSLGCPQVEAAGDTLPDGTLELAAEGSPVSPAGAAAAPGAVPCIAFGNMMDSGLLRRLYHGSYDMTDRAWPGVGGWVVRAVPRSLPGLPPLIVAGTSDEHDAPAAAAALGRALLGGGLRLPILHEVHLGRGAPLYARPAERFLQQPATPWENTGGSGDWDYLMLVAQMGMAAMKTGEQRLIDVFLAEILRFAEVRFFHRQRPDPVQIHGFLRHLLLPFVLLEHHPAVSAARHRQVLETLVALFRSSEGAGNASLLEDAGRPRVRQNHGTRTALDLYWGGRYFSTVHGLDEGRAWMDLADRFFAPQLESAKPACDSWGHQWAASLYNTADYALLTGRVDYLTGPVFRQAADRALMAHSNVESPPLLYLLMAAAVTDNPEYLQLCRVEDEGALIRRAVSLLGGDEIGRSWVTGRAAQAPARLGGVQVAPLARLFYDSIESYPSFAPPGVYRRDVPLAATFDKISFRTGWSPADDYLLLDGVSGGSHSYQDAQCLVRYSSGGVEWFGGPRHGTWATGTVHDFNGVSVSCDAAGPGCEPRYARLRYCQRAAGVEAAGTSLEYPEHSQWFRHVLRHADGFFLVIDEVKALRAGDFHVVVRWYLRGRVAWAVGGVCASQGGARLVLVHEGSARQALEPVYAEGRQVGACWRQEAAQPLRLGEVLRLATLFWTEVPPGAQPAEARAAAAGHRAATGGRSTGTGGGAGGRGGRGRRILEETDAGFRVTCADGEALAIWLEEPLDGASSAALDARESAAKRTAARGPGGGAGAGDGLAGRPVGWLGSGSLFTAGRAGGIGLDSDEVLPGGRADPGNGKRWPGGRAHGDGVLIRGGRLVVPGAGPSVLVRAGAFRRRPRGLIDAWQYRGPGAVTALVAAPPGAPGGAGWVPEEPGAAAARGPDAPVCAAGFETGQVVVLDSAGRALWESRAGEAPIRALAFRPDGGLVAGGDDATVRCLGPAGEPCWACRIDWQPMSWEYWTRGHCGVLALAAGDLDADGHVEVVAGCADRHVYAFAAGGRRLWRSACEWGVPTSLELAPAGLPSRRSRRGASPASAGGAAAARAVLSGSAAQQAAGGLEVLVGLSEPAIHGWCRVYDAGGVCRRLLQRPDIACWSIPSWVRVLRVVDLDDDGGPEVLVGLQTNHFQLVVYRAAGGVAWQADTGAGVLSLEVGWVEPGDERRVYAGTASGHLLCFTSQGRRLWHAFVAQAVLGLAPRRDGSCLALCADGSVLELDPTGQLRSGWHGSRRPPAWREADPEEVCDAAAPVTGATTSGQAAASAPIRLSQAAALRQPLACRSTAGLVTGGPDGTVQLFV